MAEQRQGGVKYQVPENIQERKELFAALKEMNVVLFREFIESNVPDLVSAGWLQKTDEELMHLMHEYRSQVIGMNEDFVKSRNYLRAEAFGYAPDEADQKPLCATCRWFREAPADEGNDAKACMHMGSIPQDIACKGYSGLS